MIDRIKQLLDWQQLSPTQFADRIGVGRPVVSHILSERNKPSLEVVQRIIAAFPDLSLPWLLSGSGAMLAAPSQAAATTLGASAPVTAAPSIVPPVTLPPGTQRQDPAATVVPAPEPGRPASTLSEPQPAFPQRAVSAATAGPARFRAEATAAVPAVAAARFVASSARPAPTRPAVDEQPESAAATQESLAAAEFASTQLPAAEPAAAEARAAAPAPVASPPALVESAALAQALGESLGTPGKTIRRIVLFYTDGSFADYKPE